jgi:TPR repeat protein
MRSWTLFPLMACAIATLFGLALTGCGGPESAQSSLDNGRYEAAFARWQRLALLGDPSAQNQVGWMYERGVGVNIDLQKAVKWYRKRAKSDYATAQTNLGLMYLNGTGVKQDAAIARLWFENASKKGAAKATNNLGVLFDRGAGVPENIKLAAELFRRAGFFGAMQRQKNLGILHRFGRGVERDPARAK